MQKNILVIDDDQELVKMLKIRLEANGYDVYSSFDGNDGLDKARKLKPDLIILDLMLPKLNGYQVCRMLKFDEQFRKIPIIIFSARDRDVDKELGGKVGADAYVTKPFDDEILLEKIHQLLLLV